MFEQLGVKQPALARWKAGGTVPTLDTLFRVAKALGLEFTVIPDAPLTRWGEAELSPVLAPIVVG